MKQKDGKYLIMKDPNKPMIRLYDIPDNTFESDGETESDDDVPENSTGFPLYQYSSSAKPYCPLLHQDSPTQLFSHGWHLRASCKALAASLGFSNRFRLVLQAYLGRFSVLRIFERYSPKPKAVKNRSRGPFGSSSSLDVESGKKKEEWNPKIHDNDQNMV
ncbi:hypothetical protein NQ317_017602, partial [Molorchus minor]